MKSNVKDTMITRTSSDNPGKHNQTLSHGGPGDPV